MESERKNINKKLALLSVQVQLTKWYSYVLMDLSLKIFYFAENMLALLFMFFKNVLWPLNRFASHLITFLS